MEPMSPMGGELSAGAGGTEEGTVGLRKSKGRVETAKDRVRPLAESASEKLGPAVGTAREKVSPYAEKAVERGAHLAHQAVEKAGPVLDDALAKVGPATEHAAERARERLNDDVLPKVTAALATLAAAAEPVVEETARRGKATKAALKGELDVPKKSHKLRNVVLFLGLGALAAAAVKKLLTPPEPAWQSTPTSGRDYSSAPTGTTSRPETKPGTEPGAKPGTEAGTKAGTEAGKPGAEAGTKAGTASANGKTDAPQAESPLTESAQTDSAKDASAAETEVNASANGVTKKAASTRKASDPKPSDS